MSTFDLAIPTILAHEGGFVDDPDDPGGATNWGISLRYYRKLDWPNIDVDVMGLGDGDLDGDGDVDVDDIKVMTRYQALAIYNSQWWVRYKYYLINPQVIATKVFDLSVNMGAGRAHRLLQQALRAVGREVEVDGVVGPKTRAAIRYIVEDVVSECCLYDAY